MMSFAKMYTKNLVKKKKFSKNNKNIFQEAKKLFNLMVKIYKKLFFERKNLRPEETTIERGKLEKQKAEEEKEINDIRDENNFIDYKKLARLINFENRSINNELVREHFSVQDLGAMLKQLRDLKSNSPKNKVRVYLINSGLKDLKKRN